MSYAAVAAIAFLAAGFPGCSSYSEQHIAPCSRAKVGGKVVCLGPGQPCRARYERVYRSYGLTCKEERLRERNYIGPANP